MQIAGIVMFAAVLLLLSVLLRDKFTVLVVSLPVTLIFTILGILPGDMTILLILVAVLGLAYAGRDAFSRRQ